MCGPWCTEGYFGNTPTTLTLHWDGTAWSRIPSPNVEMQNYLSGVDGMVPDDVWAVGSLTTRYSGYALGRRGVDPCAHAGDHRWTVLRSKSNSSDAYLRCGYLLRTAPYRTLGWNGVARHSHSAHGLSSILCDLLVTGPSRRQATRITWIWMAILHPHSLAAVFRDFFSS